MGAHHAKKTVNYRQRIMQILAILLLANFILWTAAVVLHG